MNEITEVLEELGQGRQEAFARLIPLVHEELRALAAQQMSKEPPGHTLQTTALVNEAYLKLLEQSPGSWKNRGHFLAAAARAMRRILVDHARARRSWKRGGHAEGVALDEVGVIPGLPSVDWLDLDQVLTDLARRQPRAAQVVELRFFAGMAVKEVAEFLGITPRSVHRNWLFAQAWLYRSLKNGWDTEADGATQR